MGDPTNPMEEDEIKEMEEVEEIDVGRWQDAARTDQETCRQEAMKGARWIKTK